MTAPLDVGAEAWALITESSGDRSASGERRTLVDAALVRVLELPGAIDLVDGEREGFYVEIIRSAGRVLVGRRLDLLRRDLYACNDRDEHAAFGAEVRRFWGRQ